MHCASMVWASLLVGLATLSTPSSAAPPRPVDRCALAVASLGMDVTQHGAVTLYSGLGPVERGPIGDRLQRFVHAWRAKLATLIPEPRPRVQRAPKPPIRVLLLWNQARYQAYSDRCAPGLKHHGGFYDGRQRLVVSYRYGNPLGTLFHELAHALVGDHLEDPEHRRLHRQHWPVWFEEGLAEYAATAAFDAGGTPRFGGTNSAHLASLADLDVHPLELRGLTGGTLERFAAADKQGVYARAWALAHMLLGSDAYLPERKAVAEALRNGSRIAHAAAWTRPLSQVTHDLRDYIRGLLRAPPSASIGWGGFEPLEWTEHQPWRPESGGAYGADSTGQRAAYLTRGIDPTSALEFDVSFRRANSKVRVGVALGYQDTGGYPFHTLVELGRDGLTLQHVTSPTQADLMAAHPKNNPSTDWVRLRVGVADGLIVAETSDGHIVSAPLPHRGVSLVGVFVANGKGWFRDLGYARTQQPHH